MRANISMVKDYLACPRLWYYRDHLKRGLGGEGGAVEYGTMFHAAGAAKLKGKLDEWLQTEIHDPYLYGQTPRWGSDALLEFTKCSPYLKNLEIPPDWHVALVEQAISCKLRHDHILEGRLDALVKWNGGWWSVQWKTCGQGVNISTYAEGIRVGWHEIAYQHLAEQCGYTPFMGTILITVKKLSMKKLDEGVQPIAIQYLAREHSMVEERMNHLVSILDFMAEDALASDADPYHTIKNPEACLGRWGKKKCQYFPICHEHSSIDDDLYMPLPDRYSEEEYAA